jgi:chromosome partition protein MukB
MSLETILGEPVTTDGAHDKAVASLAKLAELETLAAKIDDVNEQLVTARAQAQRQQEAKRLAGRLAAESEPLDSQVAVKAAVDAVELELDEQTTQRHANTSELVELERTIEGFTQGRRRLEQREVRWRELDVLAARLESELDASLRDTNELEAARELLDEHADGLRKHSDGLTGQIEAATLEARTLEQSGGAFPDGLLAVRDAVEGELLAGFFDDIEPDLAGHVQARLGPMAEAIVVQDLDVAVARLGALERTIDTVWFVEGQRASALVDLDETDAATGTDVHVPETNALRITRVPTQPTLGRKARLRRIGELRKRVETLGRTRAEVETEVARVSSRRRELALLLADLETLRAGDPTRELRELAEREQAATRRKQTLRERQATLEAALRASSRRAKDLRELLAEAHWLDAEDLEQRVSQLEENRRVARRARVELDRTQQARASLREHVDTLGQAPLSDPELAVLRERFDWLGVRRQDTFSALDALSYVAVHRDALEWTDAQQALDRQQALLPALEQQRTRARSRRDSAVTAARQAREQAQEARKRWQDIDGQHAAIVARLSRDRAELDDTGVDDPSDGAVSRIRERSENCKREAEELDARHRQLDQDLAVLADRLRTHQEKLDELEEELAASEREWQPSQDQWERLRTKAQDAGLVSAAIASRLLERGSGSVNSRHEALSKAELLLERLATARGGEAIFEQTRTWLGGRESSTADSHLQAWAFVRDWLRRRVPAQVAEVDDPLEALERLRAHLVALDTRLARDEDTLRGTSEGVANGIDVHIQAAMKQVKRLNQSLQGVRFGTIQRMEIRLERKPTMERILSALRKGESQELLFSAAMPIEQALEELFSRHGGGRTGGQKLLDYREYLAIHVEILRQAETTWERVNPSRVSTGEAIGIGAALMMVVLTAWEHAAKLLLAKRSLGTLRLLFLDEANRLSRDNLEVLFDLCKNLDLQLLIAAPEVASAQGCTTYRLIRRKTNRGDEEVVVSGRRVLAEVSA